MKLIMALILFLPFAPAKVANDLLIKKDLFARGEMSEKDITNWIEKQNREAKLGPLEKDLLDQENELLKEYMIMSKKDHASRESYLDEKIGDLEKLCLGPFRNSQFESYYSSSRYWYRLVLATQMKNKIKKKAYQQILEHLALRSKFTFEEALAVLSMIKELNLKTTYKNIMSRYVEVEYTTTYRPQIPNMFTPFFTQ